MTHLLIQHEDAHEIKNQLSSDFTNIRDLFVAKGFFKRFHFQ